ncbi:Triphosphate tunel metalloenzyme 3 [Spatholobus suberectus]|nr:Triphosphate tunel metalloenzyme 3 [Spatholobus suberectus]
MDGDDFCLTDPPYLLSPCHVKTHHYQNLFFDNVTFELSTYHVVLCLRFNDNVKLCIVSLKAKVVLVDDASCVEEE